MTSGKGLTALSTVALRGLRDRISSGSIGVPLTGAVLQAAGFPRVFEEVLEAIDGLIIEVESINRAHPNPAIVIV